MEKANVNEGRIGQELGEEFYFNSYLKASFQFIESLWIFFIQGWSKCVCWRKGSSRGDLATSRLWL
jgi:hypothetical protein